MVRELITPEENKGTVCVTGATGFLASWLVMRLLRKGYRVRATVRDPGNKSKVAHLRALPGASERLELVGADLLTHGSFDAVVNGCQGVFHTASPVTIVKKDPQMEMIEPAVNGTLNVLSSCAKAPSVKRVVLTSSTAAIRFRDGFPANSQLDETSWSSIEFCTKHKIWYHLAKTLAEKAAWEFARKNKLDLVVVLPSFVVGPVLPPELSSTAADVLGLLKGTREKFEMHSRMGYVHVDDVASAHILVFEQPSAEGRYICSATELDVTELGEYLANYYPELPVPTMFPNRIPVPYYTLNTEKLERLGLEFKSLKEMFEDCIASFRSKGLL
ncbi:hypothetical protein O6H91_04G132800 [Diphasiastrum complanatum]|uniref:Uncharacterized protein n=1 Tax=Diphasiastrum complanatum TaxID=34168 RepID=A0ACC2E1M2_DIPCM|nr:hypothetical protein O6H91_04G132800 [Diphasiastrum complanatum]